MKPTILVEEGTFVAVMLGRKDVTSDYTVVDVAKWAQCERCAKWTHMWFVVIEGDGPILCPTCANLKV